MNNAARLAVVSCAIAPNTADDRKRLAGAIQQLTAEDPGCSVRPGPVSGQVLIGASSDQYLEGIVDRLRREFQVDASVGPPEVVYREAITQPTDGEMTYTRQSSGGRQYAHVKIRLYPRELGAGYVFENHVLGGAVPTQFMQAVRSPLSL